MSPTRRTEAATETSAFLAEEAEKLKNHIAELDRRLAEFKEQNAGKLPEMLDRAADIHAREAERRALFFTSLLEPILILTMGLVVMLIVMAVLLPIIEINQLVR